MQVELPEKTSLVTLRLDPQMTDDEYFEFCMSNPKVRFERSAQGEITIGPPASPESDYESLDAARQLGNWARRDARGKPSG